MKGKMNFIVSTFCLLLHTLKTVSQFSKYIFFKKWFGYTLKLCLVIDEFVSNTIMTQALTTENLKISIYFILFLMFEAKTVMGQLKNSNSEGCLIFEVELNESIYAQF